MIIVDENVEQYWISLLKQHNYEIISISELFPQTPDKSVIEIAKKNKGILLTEDKDFGELVFAHGIKGLTVIFIRYDQPQYELIEERVLSAVAEYHNREDFFFITITKNHTRIRRI
jgi:predicted nuclease of predicted toxin-antitoxin system